MANILSIWAGLTMAKKAALVGVLLATLAVFAALIHVASQPRMAFLYGGLDPAAAGEVLSALEGMDVSSEVRGDAIYVEETKRDSVRMALARQGLPQQGQPGFELLDEMNGFAATSDMFDAAYWRAKEGELARTILATPGVKAARVHLAAPASSSFARARRAPSASATITMARGKLGMQHATAIRYLIALAVPDLDPEQVAIMDSVHGIVLKPGSENPETQYNEDEIDRIRRLERDLVDLIEARVGPDNARVSVSMSIDRERETVSERILDPETRVLMNRDTSEAEQSDTGGVGAVTVASNLPEGDVNGGASPSSSRRKEATETARYEISEVRREREKLPGAIARINVAVLLNEPEGEGGARAPAELEAIRDLVAAAIGYDEARGDVVTVRAMPFHVLAAAQAPVEENGLERFLRDHLMSILQILIPALVVLILGFFVIRPVLMQSGSPETAIEPMATDPALPAPAAAIAVAPKSPVEELRDMAAARRNETTTVLKSWLGETEEAA